MIIKRDAFKAVLPATTSDDTRYFLHAVQIETDGSVVATDGHILLRVIDNAPMADEDFPVKGIPEFKGNPPGPVLIDVSLVDKIVKAMPKKVSLPILQTAQLTTNGNGHYLSTTDLEAPTVAHLDQNENQFPNWQRVIPKADRPVVKVCLGVPVLQALLKSAQAVGSKTITFSIPIQKPIVDAALSMTFTGSDADLTVEGLAMPCRV